MNQRIQLVAMMCSLPLYLVGCGGGGGGETTATSTTLTGTVVDAAVQGLNYSCAPSALSGITGANGSYSYKAGDTCSFAIGSISIGSAPADGVVSPIDFVTNGDSSNTTVLNIVRTLMMLDADGIPGNGITLAPVRVSDFVASAVTVDFSSLSFDADMSNVASALSVALPDSTVAQAHFEYSMRCAYSGAFVGSYSGDSTGRWGGVVDPVTGMMVGALYDNNLQTLQAITGSGALALDQDRAFISGSSGGLGFTARLDTFYRVSGTWTGTVDAVNVAGTLSGERYAASSITAPAFRFVGGYTGDSSGFFALEADDNNNVAGQAYNPYSDELTPLTGTYNPGTGAISLHSADNAVTADGDYNSVTGEFTGTWTGLDGSTPISGDYAGHGCSM
jgi:hypothetical protein